MEENRAKGRRRLLSCLLILLVAAILLLILWLVFHHYYGMMNIRSAEELAAEGPVQTEAPLEPLELTADTEPEATPAPTPEPTTAPIAEEGVYNLLLMGTDSRSDNYKSRTDAMMLVSVNKDSKTIYLTSFLRDIHVLIPNWGYQRLNAANVVGGPAKLMETIEYNFGITIDNYAFVNFYSFVDVVDALGGIDLTLTDPEVYYVNYWVADKELQVDGSARTQLEYTQEQEYHLDGMQTLAYCRMRNIGSDPGRAQRQRTAMGLLWEKAQGMSLLTLTDIMGTVLPQITTDVSEATCLSLLASVAAYRDFTVVSQQIPADGTYSYATIDEMSVLALDFAKNQAFLQETIYGKTEE